MLWAVPPEQHEQDTFSTSKGDLVITFLGHASLIFQFGGKIIHVDPYGRVADYSLLPKADFIFVTHEHSDHFDAKAFALIVKPETIVVGSKSCAGRLEKAHIMNNNETRTFDGLHVESVPAYNIKHKRPDGSPFHPKGNGNGYIITFGDKRVYIAGDTENIPEMKANKDIDIAFLPMNVPYTMTPEMTADAALSFRPKIIYPYHYSETDPSRLVELLKNEKAIEVRIRQLR